MIFAFRNGASTRESGGASPIGGTDTAASGTLMLQSKETTMYFAWLHTSSTNVGIAGILTAIAGFLTGATDPRTAVMLALGSAVSIVLPEKKP
jgi:hypothetical protein